MIRLTKKFEVNAINRKKCTQPFCRDSAAAADVREKHTSSVIHTVAVNDEKLLYSHRYYTGTL